MTKQQTAADLRKAFDKYSKGLDRLQENIVYVSFLVRIFWISAISSVISNLYPHVKFAILFFQTRFPDF